MKSLALGALRLAGGVARSLQTPKRVILLPPTTGGSLGDQAMIDAACERLVDHHGRAVAIFNPYGPGESVAIRARHTHLAPSAALASRFGAKVATATSSALALIGADSIDGVYGARRGVMRLRLIADAMTLGLTAVVFGSSFSTTPAPEVVAQLRRMPGLRLLARDPISRDRMETALDRPVELVADVAFLLRPEALAPQAKEAVGWIEAQRSRGRQVIVFNASGHTLSALSDGPAAVIRFLEAWLERRPDTAVLLTPHDTRPYPTGDVEPLVTAMETLGPRFGERLQILLPPFDAWDAKAVAKAAGMVVTGRMHLAIAALGSGVPALCVVYQGKFEGLMRHFGVTGMTMSPEDFEMTEAAAIPALDQAYARREAVTAQIRARLPHVQELSRRNFTIFDDAKG